MLSSGKAGCRFCLENALLIDQPLGGNRSFYMLGSIDPTLAHAAMIIPRRHAESPFDIRSEEWMDLEEMLATAKAYLAPADPDGFTVGWNVGAAGGQHVFHAHLHVIARFTGEPNAGKGIRAVIRG
ncbi:diadenosine tetraphosphate (Ap4A) HIT family hydrolase [Rhizobium sp. BK313]|uniref:HIT family protein n=1 Tax=Rhizobium sp. BK313 TaxID=2587081 RepID=UPI0010DE581C|nr:HIT domain-containing protein [Rhizobium sp. BK313]MBB3456529.1 diadenosine tetraphosphate (Ap4A) HIT family hydrolase [Rhizobium sp. BK313]